MRAKLNAAQLRARLALLSSIAVGCLFLRAVDPAGLGWLPFHPSCGAITGLPCIFCGTTRALHQLANGNFAQALYLNWLAFPLAVFALALAGTLIAEIFLQRRLLPAFPTLQLTPRFAALSASALLALWIFQVSLALSLHKHELLNPNGVLYRLVVR